MSENRRIEMPEDEKQWFTNKDLFLLIGDVQNDFNGLRSEMRETRMLMKQYNGLREELGEMKEEFESMKAMSKGRNSVGTAIRNWGGWIFALITLIILLVNTF